MSTFWNVLIVILLVLVIALALLYYFGQKAQKKQAAQQEQLEATRQVVSMLIIDKKRLKLRNPVFLRSSSIRHRGICVVRRSRLSKQRSVLRSRR